MSNRVGEEEYTEPGAIRGSALLIGFLLEGGGGGNQLAMGYEIKEHKPKKTYRRSPRKGKDFHLSTKKFWGNKSEKGASKR